MNIRKIIDNNSHNSLLNCKNELNIENKSAHKKIPDLNSYIVVMFICRLI